MRMLGVWSLAISLCLNAGCGGIYPYAAEQEIEKSFIPMPNPTIVADTFNGRIEFRQGEGMSLTVQVTKRCNGRTELEAQDELAKIDVVIEELEGNIISIEAKRALGHASVNGGARIYVTLPGPAAARLKTSNGNIVLASPVIDVDASTSNGAIHVSSCQGPIKATSSNGEIKIGQAKGKLELKSSNGDIQMDQIEAGLVQAQTSNGRIKFQGELVNGDHEFTTTNGVVSLRLPPEAAFAVDAKTSNARVISTFDVKKSGRDRTTQLIGTVGSQPKINLKLRSANGNIQIMSQDD